MNRRTLIWIDMALRSAMSWVNVDESPKGYGRRGALRTFSASIKRSWRDFYSTMERQRWEQLNGL
jgi:hypothetical protein